jgi:hypothetical protein
MWEGSGKEQKRCVSCLDCKSIFSLLLFVYLHARCEVRYTTEMN